MSAPQLIQYGAGFRLRGLISVTCCAVFLLLGGFGRAQENNAKNETQKTPNAELQKWTTQEAKYAAGAMIVAAQDPFIVLGLRMKAKTDLLWGLEEDDGPLTAPVLYKKWLEFVPNNELLFDLGEQDASRLSPEEVAEQKVFSQALVYTARWPYTAFENSAQASEGLTYGKMLAEPEKHQGLVVTLEGWLKRIERKDAPAFALTQLVDHYHEGWLYTGFDDANPVLVTFAELPEGMEPGNKLDYYVRVRGYFFKKFRYLSDTGSKHGLLVMARTCQVLSQMNPQAEGNLAPKLNREWLKYVKDDTAFGDFRHAKPTPAEKFEVLAYSQALTAVAKTPAEAFANSAKEYDWGVSFANIFMEPWKFRGKVIPIKGRLRRLRRFDATVDAAKQGVKHFYEGWVYMPMRDSQPVCVNFAHLPEGVEPGEQIDLDVSFNGYFFKRYGYLSNQRDKDGNLKARRTLFFFAPTFTVEGRGRSPGIGITSMSGTMLMGLAALGFTTICIIVGLTIWFKRGDAKVHAKLASVRRNLTTQDEGAMADADTLPIGYSDDAQDSNHAFGIDDDDPTVIESDVNQERFTL